MNKNEFIARVAVFFAGYVIVYLMGAFVGLSLDPREWPAVMRLWVAGGGLLFAALISTVQIPARR